MAPQVARVIVSPFDDLLSFREAIKADTSSPQNVAVLRQRTPGFTFLYADGVPIDRRQEGRILVGDIAVAAPHSRSVESGFSRSNEKCALIQSFRGLDSRVGKAACSTLADGGVLHRWEHFRGSSWAAEVKIDGSFFDYFTPWTIDITLYNTSVLRSVSNIASIALGKGFHKPWMMTIYGQPLQ